jgi:hypothetical protein
MQTNLSILPECPLGKVPLNLVLLHRLAPHRSLNLTALVLVFPLSRCEHVLSHTSAARGLRLHAMAEARETF